MTNQPPEDPNSPFRGLPLAPPPSFEKHPDPSGGYQPYGQPPPHNQYQPYGQPPPYNPYQPYGQPAPYGPPNGMVYDPQSGLNLPPGVQFASIGRRIGAFFLRIVLITVTLGIGYIIWGLFLWSKGTSPALRVLGMKVWHIDAGEPASFGYMALRNIVGTIVEIIVGGITLLVSFILFCATQKRQSLHDLIASTTVVYDPNKVLG